jgi:4-hydroxybenzoyl-CoA thioesterase
VGFKAQMKVRFSDVDNAGIVYYPRFFHYFHVAFEELFNEHFQIPYQAVLHEDYVGFPVVHVESDFQIPLQFGDRIEIEVLVERIGSKSATFAYLVRRQGEDPVCARASITVASMDMKGWKAQPIPDKYRQLFESYQSKQGG